MVGLATGFDWWGVQWWGGWGGARAPARVDDPGLQTVRGDRTNNDSRYYPDE
jgi:hypothetical protein